MSFCREAAHLGPARKMASARFSNASGIAMKPLFRPAALAALLAVCGSLNAAPRQDTPGLSQSLFVTPTVQFATPGATTGTFTPYERVKDYLETMARTSGAKLYSLLRTAQGREVWALRLGNPQAKVRVMVYSRVHGDEPAASEGALAFLDALTRGELVGRYDDVQIVVVPMANPDGAVALKRVTAKGGDINRDFVKYDYPETRAIQGEILRFDPHVVVDAHEFTVWGRLGERTSASDMQSAGPNEPNLPKALVDAHERLFRTAISRNFAQYGLRHDLYELLSMDKASGKLRVAESATTFVSAKNYHAMSGRFSFLFETRGIGLGDQHMARRTLSHYQGMKAVVETAQSNADAIAGLVAEARRTLAATAAWELDRKPVRVARDFALADGPSGRLVSLPVEFVKRTEGTPGTKVAVPRYYLIPQSAKASVDLLAQMGVTVSQLRQPLTASVGVQTATIAKHEETLKVESRTSEAKREFVAGDYVIDTRQRANLLLQVLEGASPNGFARAGLFGRAGSVELPFYRYDGRL